MMANLNLNKVILAGRLTAAPELKQTPNGNSVCSFSLAVNRRGKDAQTDFITCQAWRQTAEFLSRYFKKGSSLCIVGNLQKREWTDKDGQKRYATEVVVDEALFVDSKSEAPGSEASGADNYNPYNFNAPTEPNFEALGNDDDLPF